MTLNPLRPGISILARGDSVPIVRTFSPAVGGFNAHNALNAHLLQGKCLGFETAEHDWPGHESCRCRFDYPPYTGANRRRRLPQVPPLLETQEHS
jgi:hypothetical protein